MNDKRSIAQFNDAYAKIKTVKGAEYTKILFYNDLCENKDLLKGLPKSDDGTKSLLSMKEIATAATAYAADVVKSAPPKMSEDATKKQFELKNEGGKILAERSGKKMSIEKTADGKLKIDGDPTKKSWMIKVKGELTFLKITEMSAGLDSTITGKLQTAVGEKTFTLTKDLSSQLFENILSGNTLNFEQDGIQLECTPS